ncbi:MAG: hypothetical protein R3D44_10770 [Hyphomicrobiaceae bacterium]
MLWQEFIGSALRELQSVLRDDRAARMAALSCLAVLVALTLLTVLFTRVRRRRAHVAALAEPEPRLFASPEDLGDWGPTETTRRRKAVLPREAAKRWPIDSVLPQRFAGTLALAVVAAACTWLAGLALAPSIPVFLASPEWHFQPLYFATHIIALRLFIDVYTRGFERGVGYLDVPESQATSFVESVLGFPGAIAALSVAMPFVALDFLYLFSDRYQRVGGAGVMPIDYLMWGIWSVEWFLNAFIWVVLIGFLVKTWWVVRNHPFRAPIEIVLHDRQYKPFLQMGAHGATIVLAFTIVTVAYIWYTGGELTDYVGLCITAVLLVLGFLPSWLLLKAKVHRAVEEETLAMRRRLLRNLELAEAETSAAIVHNLQHPGSDARSLEHRLDAAVSILRISYLENRHQSLGASEARAVLVRMLAPALSVGWQLAKSQTELIAAVQAYFARMF